MPVVGAFSLVALLFALVISAKPVVGRNQIVSLSLTRQRRSFTATYKPVAHDRARAQALTKANAQADIDLLAVDFGNLVYGAAIGVGNPPAPCK
jgi:hypothetical protein